jgi:hypothetical protein
MRGRSAAIVRGISLAAMLLYLGLAGGLARGVAVPPVIGGLSPTSHAPGTFPVILSGSNFTGVNTVYIYNYPSGTGYYFNAPFEVDNDGQITVNHGLSFTLPSGTFYFELFSPQGHSNNSPNLTVAAAAAVISGINPTKHLPGAFSLVLTGYNFTGVTDIPYSGPTMSNVNVYFDSDAQITIDGTLSGGTYSFQVVTPNGTSNPSPAMIVSAGNSGAYLLLLED